MRLSKSFIVQCDVDDKHIIFPYFTKKGIINFCFRERSEYDTAEVKRKEVLAYILYILSGLFLSRKNIWIVYEKFCKMAQDNGYYFFKYCMENLDEKEKKNMISAQTNIKMLKNTAST